MIGHFTRAELIRSKMAQEKGIDNTPPESLNSNLDFTMAGCERVRSFLGMPMFISSGYRCPALNEAVGGSESSQHLRGEAVDFTCPGFGTPEEICRALRPKMAELGIDQIIMEGTWVHMSFTLQPRYSALKAIGGGHYIPLPC